MALYSAIGGSFIRNVWLKSPHKWLNSTAIIKSHSLAKSPLETIVQSNHHHSLSVSLNDQSFENYSEKLLTRDMLLKENVPTYKSFYDQETLELCRELYMEDFKTYHYTLDYKL